MSRKDENEKALKIIVSKAKLKGSCEELVTDYLGSIACLLVDISKSLAIIADALDEGRAE